MINLTPFDRVQSHSSGIRGVSYFFTGKPHSRRCNVAKLPLFYHYIHDKCADELHSLVLSVQRFTPRTDFSNKYSVLWNTGTCMLLQTVQ